MNSVCKEFLKSIPLLGPVLKYINSNFIKSQYSTNATVFSLHKNIQDVKEFEITKTDKNKTLYMDRLSEVKLFFNKNFFQMLTHFMVNGTANTDYYKYRLHKIFENTGLTENRLKLAYKKAAFTYVNRLMLRYHQYRIGELVLEIVNELSLDKSETSVLDYGCGVADPSLYLVLNGIDATIVDLDDEKFDFAVWRFKKRNLSVESLKATQTEKPVELGDKEYDVIIMAEFLEHVRNPRLFLEFALNHLNSDRGILFDSLGPEYKHGVGGDHLKEAKDMLGKTDYAEYFNARLCPLNEVFKTDKYKHFYIKRSYLKEIQNN